MSHQALDAIKSFSRLVIEERSGVLASKERWAEVAAALGAYKPHPTSTIGVKTALHLLLAAACDRGECVTGAGEEAHQCMADIEATPEQERHRFALDCVTMLCGWRSRVDTNTAALDTDHAARNETSEVWAFALAAEAMSRVSQP